MGIDKFRRKAVFKGKSIQKDDIEMDEGKNIKAGTATGSKIGTAITQKLGFWNKAPIIQPKHADQTDQGAMTFTHNWDGTSAYPTAAQGDAIIADLAALDKLLTAMRTALVDAGIIKGSA